MSEKKKSILYYLGWAGMFASVITMNPVGLAISFTSMMIAADNADDAC